MLVDDERARLASNAAEVGFGPLAATVMKAFPLRGVGRHIAGSLQPVQGTPLGSNAT